MKMEQKIEKAIEDMKNWRLAQMTSKVHSWINLDKTNVFFALFALLQAEVEHRNMLFDNNDETRKQLLCAAEWITSIYARIGLMLCGRPGTGKTTLIKAIKALIDRYNLDKEEHDKVPSIKIIDANEISRLCNKDYDEFMNLTKVPVLGIDDIGTEPMEIMNYGNRIRPICELLYRRYDEQLRTIITTNLTPSQIGERYGERIADRLEEMMDRIVFENNSYRTKEKPHFLKPE